jgi:hypothetical protein
MYIPGSHPLPTFFCTKKTQRVRSLLVSGKDVSSEAVSAKREGASDMDLHDTVLIAAMFCMFNRYVDRLSTEMPQDIGSICEKGSFDRGEGIC